MENTQTQQHELIFQDKLLENFNQLQLKQICEYIQQNIQDEQSLTEDELASQNYKLWQQFINQNTPKQDKSQIANIQSSYKEVIDIFFHKNKLFLERKQQKLEHLRRLKAQKEAQEIQYRTNINKNSNKIICKNAKYQKDEIYQRNIQQIENKNRTISQLQYQKEKKQLAQCTHNPILNNYSQEYRSAEEFYNSQIKWKDKIENSKQKKEIPQKSIPNIDHKSKIISKEYCQDYIIDRFDKDLKNRKVKLKQLSEQSVPSFQPFLYEDLRFKQRYEK